MKRIQEKQAHAARTLRFYLPIDAASRHRIVRRSYVNRSEEIEEIDEDFQLSLLRQLFFEGVINTMPASEERYKKVKVALDIVFALLILSVICLGVAMSQFFSFDFAGRHYRYEISRGTAIITDYRGTAAEVNVPKTLSGYPVVAIANTAFAENETITRIVLPEGLVAIADSAFIGCSNLVAAAIPVSVTNIGRNVFALCHEDLVIYGASGSTAEEYALGAGIPFVANALRRA